MMKTTLISKTLHDNIAHWTIQYDGETISITFGSILKRNVVNSQTIHMVLATDEESKAEYERRVKLKLVAGYIEYNGIMDYNTVIALLPRVKTDLNNYSKPMKANVFKLGKMRYPALIQPKINGCRCTVRKNDNPENSLFIDHKMILVSKNGEIYKVDHVLDYFDELIKKNPEIEDRVFDGELYAYGYKAAAITGASRNPANPLNKQLVFVNFDLAEDNLIQEARTEQLIELYRDCMPRLLTVDNHPEALYSKQLNNAVYLLYTGVVKSDKEARVFRDIALNAGYEGAILRDLYAEYGFGQRVPTMLKLKQFEFGMFTVVDIVHRNDIDKLPLFILRNDISKDLFEASCTGKHEDQRMFLEAKDRIIGQQVELKYGERTINNIPHHHNVLAESVIKLLKQNKREKE